MKREDLPAVPKKLDELAPAIQKLIDDVSDPTVTLGIESDGYGKCVEAMQRAAYLVHEYVASQLGVTGFQHDASSLRLLGMLRGYEGPFMVLDGENALYPQYDLEGRVREWLGSDETRTWLAEQARQKIAESEGQEPITLDDGSVIPPVHGAVRKHWEKLAGFEASIRSESGDDRG
jgi:hypothetical protein